MHVLVADVQHFSVNTKYYVDSARACTIFRFHLNKGKQLKIFMILKF